MRLSVLHLVPSLVHGISPVVEHCHRRWPEWPGGTASQLTRCRHLPHYLSSDKTNVVVQLSPRYFGPSLREFRNLVHDFVKIEHHTNESAILVSFPLKT